MKKIYSAKLVYKNYLSFLTCKIINKQFLVLFCLIFFVYIFIVGFGGIISYIQNPSSFTWNELLLNILTSSLAWWFVFIFFPILSSYFSWRQNFYLLGSKIIDNYPTKKELPLNYLELIILESPQHAGLIFKHPQDSLKTVVYWHGNSEKEWTDFLKLLIKNNPSIEDKIYVKASIFKGNKRIKSTVQDSYKEIQKLTNDN